MIAVSQQLTFRQVSLADAATMIPQMESQACQGCDRCFSTLFIWRSYYNNSMARSPEGWLFVRFDNTPPYLFLQPEGPEMIPQIERLLAHTRSEGYPLHLFGADEAAVERMKQHFPNRFEYRISEEDADYIYERRALAELKGKAYDGKRNHIATFSRQHDWRFEPLTDENLSDFLAVAEAWRAERDANDASLKAECDGLHEALTHRETLHMRGGLIRVGEQAVAITCGAPVRNDTFDVQIEKALSAYSGAYAVINREFAASLPEQYRWLNRENDLGIAGLRRAKLSYHPAKILTKYICTERT